MNTPSRQNIASFSCLFFILFYLSACASMRHDPAPPPETTLFYPATPTAANCPVFVVDRTELPYNRIGTPSVKEKKGSPYVWVNPDQPSIYFQEQKFSTAKGNYTNLIYRIHFERIPFGGLPPHLTTGKNTGLFVIITLDNRNRPLLISTIHTCGCYLSFTPTSYLNSDTYPNNWNIKKNSVYGEKLPGLLDLPPTTKLPRFLVTIRPETHRVMDITLLDPKEISRRDNSQAMDLRPMTDLNKLPYKGDFISFYELQGWRKGHVKNSRKPLEMLFMSWWAMDPFIGEDKELGPAARTGTTFYTSLKFWRRADSNLWDFARFIKYWGWKL